MQSKRHGVKRAASQPFKLRSAAQVLAYKPLIALILKPGFMRSVPYTYGLKRAASQPKKAEDFSPTIDYTI